MNPVIVRNVEIGAGIPKICAPIVGVTKEEIIHEAEKLKKCSVDIAEWRADWFAEVFHMESVKEILRDLRDILGEMPILFTFRSLKEGGEKSISREDYMGLLQEAAKMNCVDLIDVELFFGEEVRDIIEQLHQHGVKVIASNHDFEKTPDVDEIISRLCKMQQLEADILKIAVMPQTPQDVLTLLLATEEMHRNYTEHPLVTMAMSGMGIISRLCGELFGSAITFGAAAKASAPGQVGTEKLAELLLMFHQNLQDK